MKQVVILSSKSRGGLTRERGITICQLWLGSMHKCADINNAVG